MRGLRIAGSPATCGYDSREGFKVVGDKSRAAAAVTPPVKDVDVDSLADMVTVLFEGAFVIARTPSSRELFAGQRRQYRNDLKLLFGLRSAEVSGSV